jgi:hypothetical protein
MTPQLRAVRSLLSEFCASLADGVVDLRIHFITDRTLTGEQYAAIRESTGWVLDSAGVYIIYADDGALLYIGKASTNNWIDKRAWSHEDPEHRIRGVRRRWIYAIPLPEEQAFLAPALEEFLISRLNPPANRVGRSA